MYMGSRDKLWAKSPRSRASRICSSSFISWMVMGVNVMVVALLFAIFGLILNCVSRRNIEA